MTEHRRRTRVPGSFEGLLQLPDRDLAMTTENLSLKGLLCVLEDETVQDIQPGLECTVVLPLSPEIFLSVLGAVVRQTGHKVAVDFRSMDEESYGHLRNIVRYAAQDPDLIDTEQANTPFADS